MIELKLTPREEILRILKERSAKLFDYYIKEGWFILNKEKKEFKNEIKTENFKDGEEFGLIFSKYIELGIDEYIKKL